MQTSTIKTVTKQQCDTCYRDVEVHSETVYPASGDPYSMLSGKYKETYRYPAEDVAPRFFRVTVISPSGSRAPLELELCDECVKSLMSNKYGAPNAQPQEWYEEVMEELRPSESEESEPFDGLSVADETESEVYGTTPTPDPGNF